MARPRLNVESPLFTPLPYGLLSALGDQLRTPPGGHWEAGIQWESLCAESSTTFDECFAVTGATELDVAAPNGFSVTTEYERRGATAFTVYSKINCSAPGFWDRAQNDINNVFTQSEQWQVERAFWTGLAAGQPVVYPHLAEDTELVTNDGQVLLQSAADVVVTGSVGIIEGMGRLQAALSDCYDGVGVIHVPRVLEPSLTDAGLIVREGNRYRTTQGHIVVLGAGYPGTSPSGGSSATSAYIYATGMVFVYRGPARTRTGELFSRDDNLATAEVDRTYVIGWDCCHHAVSVTIGS